MPEVKQEVNTYLIRYLCDECGKGTLNPTGIALTSYPPQYPHICDKCGRNETFWEKYPKTVYEPVED